MLRRLKSDTFDGRPILELPPRTHHVVGEPLFPSELEVYQACSTTYHVVVARRGVAAVEENTRQ